MAASFLASDLQAYRLSQFQTFADQLDNPPAAPTPGSDSLTNPLGTGNLAPSTPEIAPAGPPTSAPVEAPPQPLAPVTAPLQAPPQMQQPNPTAMLDRNGVVGYVHQRAADFGLDPAAVLAVANQEGLNTAPGSSWRLPGEGNISFGPPSWFGNGAGAAILAQHGQNAAAWSWTPPGIDYWLGQVAQAAKGLAGNQAISAIVHGFERPREDLAAGEVARAQTQYATFGQPGGEITTAPSAPAPAAESAVAAPLGTAVGAVEGAPPPPLPGLPSSVAEPASSPLDSFRSWADGLDQQATRPIQQAASSTLDQFKSWADGLSAPAAAAGQAVQDFGDNGPIGAARGGLQSAVGYATGQGRADLANVLSNAADNPPYNPFVPGPVESAVAGQASNILSAPSLLEGAGATITRIAQKQASGEPLTAEDQQAFNSAAIAIGGIAAGPGGRFDKYGVALDQAPELNATLKNPPPAASPDIAATLPPGGDSQPRMVEQRGVAALRGLINEAKAKGFDTSDLEAQLQPAEAPPAQRFTAQGSEANPSTGEPPTTGPPSEPPPFTPAPEPAVPPPPSRSTGVSLSSINATAKEMMLSLSPFHLVTELRQAYRANNPQDAARIISHGVQNLLLGNYDAFVARNADTYDRAIRAGVTMLDSSGSADLGARISGPLGSTIRGGVTGLTSGVSAYGVAKQQGASDEDAFHAGLVAAGIGTLAGAALSRPLTDAMFQRTIPTLKVMTFDLKTAAGADPRAAADFVNQTFGGGNLQAITNNTTVQDAARLALLAPDWWAGWARQIGSAFKPGQTGNMARGYWLRTAIEGTVLLQGLNYAINGHGSQDNGQGRQFDLETTGLVHATDSRTGETVRTYADVLGPIKTLLDLASAPVQGAMQGDVVKGSADALGTFARNRQSLPLSLGTAVLGNQQFNGRPIAQPGTAPLQAAGQFIEYALSQVAPGSGGQIMQTNQRQGLVPAAVGAATGIRQISGQPFEPAALSPSTDATLKSAGVSVGRPPANVTLPGNSQVSLTPGERARYDQLRAQILERYVPDLAARPSYQSAAADIQKSTLNKIVANASGVAHDQLLKEMGRDALLRRQQRKASQ